MKRAIVLAVLAGCAAPAPPPPPVEKPLAIEAADEKWAEILRQLVQGRSTAEQQQIYESQRHYELALAYYNKSDFDRAKVEAQRAVQKWGENLVARKLLSEILSLIGAAPASTTPAELERLHFIQRIEGEQIEITKHVRDGDRYLSARMYGEALKEFENAELKIRAIPYDVKAMNDLLPRVREKLARSKNALGLEEKAREDAVRKIAETKAGP